jgi:hypothetical protein
LSTGIQLFILVQTMATKWQQAQALIHVYDTVMGGATATIADAQFLVANDQALIPMMFGQARTCLTHLQAIILMAFGLYHPWNVALGTFLLEYTAREVELEAVQPRDPQYRSMVPALIVRWVQLRWMTWLQRQWYSLVNIPVLDLTELFTQIELEVAWEPTIPLQYLCLATPPTAPALPGAPPAARQPPAARVPPVALPAGGAWSNAAFRNSLYLETDFGRFRAIPIRVWDLLTSHIDTPPPMSSFDAPHFRDPRHPDEPIRICLSYHVKGMCNTACGWAFDHNPLTPEKKQELLAWCTAHFRPL